MRLIVVTGTGTGIGKTVATAALACCALAAGRTVAVVKPIQTGVLPGGDGDLAEVRRLTGLTDLHELVRYAEPLAPATVADRLGEPGPAVAVLAEQIMTLADRDLVIVEGAGGALVRFNDRGDGLCELATELRSRSGAELAAHQPGRVEVLLVTSAALGALHDAAVTAEALRRRGLDPLGLVIGDWPAAPGLAERCNLGDLSSYAGCAVLGVLAHGSGSLSRPEFAEIAVRSLPPTLDGSFDPADFIAANAAEPPMRES